MKRVILMMLFGLFLSGFVITNVSASAIKINSEFGINVISDMNNYCIDINSNPNNQNITLNIHNLCFYITTPMLKGENENLNYYLTTSQFPWQSGWVRLNINGTEFFPTGQIESFTKFYTNIENNKTGIDEVIGSSKTCYDVQFVSYDSNYPYYMNRIFVGKIYLILQSSQGYVQMDGILIDINNPQTNLSSINQKLTLLESWKQTISDTITSILNTLTNHETEIQILKDKISKLENQTLDNNSCEKFPSYLMKLSSGERKDIICSCGQERHLYGANGLGWTCGLTYKISKSGKESVTCKCIKG